MRFYLILLISCIIDFFFTSISNAQKMLDIKQIEKQSSINDVPIYKKVEDAALIVYSSIKGLDFKSSMNTIDTVKYYESFNKYIIFIKPNQSCFINVTHNAKDFYEEKIKIESLPIKSVRYYKIESLQEKINIKPGELYASSNPLGAILSFELYPKWNNSLPNTFTLPSPLSYKINVSKTDYESIDTTIYIYPNKPNSILFRLKPTFAFVNFEVTPSNSSIFIDEEIYSNSKVQKGEKKITIRAQHYYTFDTTITIEPNIEYNIFKELKPIIGYVTFKQNNENYGAKIFINNNEIGNIPIYNYPLIEGNYIVKTVKKGFISSKDEYNITIRKNENNVQNIEMLSSINVDITTYPDDANIVIDGNQYGKSNLKTTLGIGLHKIIITKDYYETKTKEIEVSEYNHTFTYTLSPKSLYVTFVTKPTGVYIYGDGIDLVVNGNVSSESVPFGKHKVTFSRDKYYSKTKVINVAKVDEKFVAKLFPKSFSHIGFSYGLNLLSMNLGFCFAKYFYLGLGGGFNLTPHNFSKTINVEDANIDDISSYTKIEGTKLANDSVAFCFNVKLGVHFMKPINFIVNLGYAGGESRNYQNVYKAQHDYIEEGGTRVINEGEYFTSSQIILKGYNAFTVGLMFPIFRRFYLGVDYYTNSESGKGFVFSGGFIF